MKPYLEHIVASTEGSWTLYNRQLPSIPFEWHYNNEFELTLTLNSQGQRFVGDSIAHYTDGDLVLIGPRIPHTWCSSSDCGDGPTHQALVLWFSEIFVQSLIHSYPELRSIQVLLENSTRAVEFSEKIRFKARRMICSMLTLTAEDRFPALLQVLLLLARDSQAKPLTSPTAHVFPDAKDKRIGRVLAFLNDHYREEVGIQRLGAVAAMSRSSLHRLFKHQTGATVTEYITQLRIGNACALLINTDRSIALIGEQVGYKNLANFNRQFKDLKEQTPKQFRSAFSRRPGMPTRRQPGPQTTGT